MIRVVIAGWVSVILLIGYIYVQPEPVSGDLFTPCEKITNDADHASPYEQVWLESLDYIGSTTRTWVASDGTIVGWSAQEDGIIWSHSWCGPTYQED